MAYIEWSGALRIGIEEIDEEHRHLIDLINELSIALSRGMERSALAPIIEELETYAARHFGVEEAYFNSFGFQGAQSHAAEHAAFAKKVGAFRSDFSAGKTELSEEMLSFLRGWLTRHISFSDRKYRALFLERGLR